MVIIKIYCTSRSLFLSLAFPLSFLLSKVLLDFDKRNGKSVMILPEYHRDKGGKLKHAQPKFDHRFRMFRAWGIIQFRLWNKEKSIRLRTCSERREMVDGCRGKTVSNADVKPLYSILSKRKLDCRMYSNRFREEWKWEKKSIAALRRALQDKCKQYYIVLIKLFRMLFVIIISMMMESNIINIIS